MKPAEEASLIRKVKNKECSASFLKLKEKHGNLFFSIVNKFSKRINVENIYLDLDFVFFKAILSYDNKKGSKFSTWLGNCTRYHCLNYLKKNSKYVQTEDDQVTSFFDKKSFEDYSNCKNFKNEANHVLNILNEAEDKRIVKIFKLRYLNGNGKMTWRDIATEFNLTPQTVINLHTKGKKIIVRRMKQ